MRDNSQCFSQISQITKNCECQRNQNPHIKQISSVEILFRHNFTFVIITQLPPVDKKSTGEIDCRYETKSIHCKTNKTLISKAAQRVKRRQTRYYTVTIVTNTNYVSIVLKQLILQKQHNGEVMQVHFDGYRAAAN